MPTLSESIGQDLSAYEPVEAPMHFSAPPEVSSQPGLNAMIRCPLPTIFQVSPDNLRQFYTGGQVPQTRIFTPSSIVVNSGNSSSTSTGTGSSGSGGGSGSGGSGGGSSPTPPQPVAQQVSVTTNPLNPGQVFVSSFLVSKSFALLGLSCNSPVRVQMYGTAQAQSFDAARGLDVPPPAGTTQNIICDVALDTAPFNWAFQSRVGSNGDSPQKSTVYVTLTNLDTKSDTITVTLSYVPLES